jgi:hypothetical protein
MWVIWMFVLALFGFVLWNTYQDWQEDRVKAWEEQDALNQAHNHIQLEHAKHYLQEHEPRFRSRQD